MTSFGIREWGVDQARSYQEAVLRSIQQLANHPGLGVAAAHLGRGQRVLRVRQHLAYFRVTEDEVVVIRVMHHKMDQRDAPRD